MDKTPLINSRTRHRQTLKALVDLLEQDQQWHVSEIAARLGCHVRTVYNCLNDLESKGIRINRNDGYPRLWDVSFDPDSAESLLIAPDDMIRINECLDVLSGRDGASLPRMLEANKSLQSVLQPYFFHADRGNLAQVRAVNTAINRHQQLVIHDYQSGHSGTVADRVVEPIHWSPGGRQFNAYDVEKGAMRTFVPARMSGATVTKTPWQHAKEHRRVEYDCFWMSGTPFQVVLRLNLLALNLLHDEYELSLKLPVDDVSHLDPAHPYQLTLECRSPFGVGRFLQGLGNNVVLVDGAELKAHMAESLRDTLKLYE